MLFRVIGAVVSAAALLWGVLPVRLNIGSVTLIVGGLLGLTVCVRFSDVANLVRRLWQSIGGRVGLLAAAAVVLAVLILFVTLSVAMVRANSRKPADNATLVVLGAALNGDQPSRLLRGRLDAAVAYLNHNPEAMCIVSGGQGRDEAYTEASVMRTYLINAGIAAERIYLEEQATSTYENMIFSRKIIEKHGLNPKIAVATQEFHQYRAAKFAEKAGMETVGAVTATTPLYLLGSYWIRDFYGICYMALFGK